MSEIQRYSFGRLGGLVPDKGGCVVPYGNHLAEVQALKDEIATLQNIVARIEKKELTSLTLPVDSR